MRFNYQILFLFLVFAGCNKDVVIDLDPDNTPAKKLIGKWEITSAMVNGEDYTEYADTLGIDYYSISKVKYDLYFSIISDNNTGLASGQILGGNFNNFIKFYNEMDSADNNLFVPVFISGWEKWTVNKLTETEMELEYEVDTIKYVTSFKQK